MLTSMRRGASGWVAKILFALLIVSFGAWGIVDYLQPDPDPVVVTVGDTEIRQSTFQNQFRRSLDGLRAQVGTTVTQEFAVQMGLDREVLDGLIDQQVLTREAQRMGMRVDESLLRAAVAGDTAFQDPSGRFDRQRYEETLFRAGLNEGLYLTDLRGRMLRDPLVAAAIATPPSPTALVQAQFGFLAEKRRAILLHRLHADLPAPGDPGDAVLRDFYDQESHRYLQPELRSFSAVLLDAGRLAAGFAISDAQIEQEYENRRAFYHTPEQREVAQLLFPDAEAAGEALARLEAGESWEAVADAPGAAANDLGQVRQQEMLSPALGEALFGRPDPGIVGPVQSPFGYHVLWVKSISPAATRPLAEVRAEIEHALALDRAVDAMVERANAVEDAIAAGGSLEAASDAADVPVQKFEGISRTGQTADGTRPADLPSAGQFLAAVFRTEEGETSVLTEMPDGSYFVVRVDRVMSEAKKPFEAVRAQVLADWSEAQRAVAAEDLAREIAEQLGSGADAEGAARAAGFAIDRPAAFDRTELPGPATPDLVDAVFAAKRGEPVVHNDADRVFVVIVEAVEQATAASGPAFDRVRQTIRRDRQLEVAEAFQRAVRSQYDVDIDQPAIDQILR